MVKIIDFDILYTPTEDSEFFIFCYCMDEEDINDCASIHRYSKYISN